MGVNTSKTSIVLALILAGGSTFTLAGWEFSAGEIACAQKRGIDLMTVPDSASEVLLGHLTWLADAAVIGRVVEIQHDLHGPYPTLVQLHVTEALKGKLAGTIAIALDSGPCYSEKPGHFCEVYASGEPSFEAGEEVLVFLTASYPIIPEDPARFILPANTYRPLGDWKYVLDSTTATLAGPPGDHVSRAWARSEVLATVAYAASCGGK